MNHRPNHTPTEPKSAETSPQLMATAYHEAGHAVMAASVGRSIQKVTIAPGRMPFGVRLGACQLKKGRRKVPKDTVEDDGLILLAGMVAEAIFTGQYCQHGAHEDLQALNCLLGSRAGSASQLEKLQRRLLAKTEYLLGNDANLKAVELIANELIRKTAISGRAVQHLCRQAQAMVEE